MFSDHTHYSFLVLFRFSQKIMGHNEHNRNINRAAKRACFYMHRNDFVSINAVWPKAPQHDPGGGISFFGEMIDGRKTHTIAKITSSIMNPPTRDRTNTTIHLRISLGQVLSGIISSPMRDSSHIAAPQHTA